MPYERLEFLGDRVLGLAIAEWLYETYPGANEGEMAKRHAALVNREALRAVAQEIGSANSCVWRAARKPAPMPPRKNLATLPDAMEAVIGALYLDGGFYGGARLYPRILATRHRRVRNARRSKNNIAGMGAGPRVAVTRLSRRSHSGPAHAPKFLIEASVKGHPPVQAEGDSKRAAQKAAAVKLIELVNKK